MKIAVSTMGRTLEVLDGILPAIDGHRPVGDLALYVCDAFHYKRHHSQLGLLKRSGVEVLKEWEIVEAARARSASFSNIARFERDLGDPTFWNVVLADRRLAFGRYCKYRQDYSSRFSHQELAAILEEALERVRDLFDRGPPDLVLSFGMVTLGDYLFYLFARSRGIPYLQLKATKIENYLSLNDGIVGLSSHVQELYENEAPQDADVEAVATRFLEKSLREGVRYEGAISPQRARLVRALADAPRSLAGALRAELDRLRDPTVRRDHHLAGIFVPAVYKNLVQPLRAFQLERRLARHAKYIRTERELEALNGFLFFPLHFEPEVSLQVFGRPYQNQIEVVRLLAHSVPFATPVVVKEHPRALGFRSARYYRKLLEIPNVYLVDPFVRPHRVIPHSQVVAVVSGTIGLEAAIAGRPVITLGPVPYNVLPDEMVRRVTDLNRLGDAIRRAIQDHRVDRERLIRYVGATVAGAVPVDFYSTVLRKVGRYEPVGTADEEDAERRRQLDKLGEYFVKRLSQLQRSQPDAVAL